MILKSFLILSVIKIAIGENSDDYMDTIISLLMDGDTINYTSSKEHDDANSVPVLTGGIWKCGDCNNLDETKLIYSEVNDVDAEMLDDQSVDIQIGLAIQNMRCVTVKADVVGVVKRISGACKGDSVTLTVAPSQHFTVNVYS